MQIAPWLFSIMTIGWFFSATKSFNSFLNHTASCTAVLRATYSASAVDSVTIGSFLLSQLTAPLLRRNRLLLVECLSSKSPA